MGNRGQVAIKGQGKGRVYLYTHWSGGELIDTVRRAMARRVRWEDAEYLTRIIFCEMVKGNETAETGFGIGLSKHGDSNNPLIVVDVATQTVKIGRSIPRSFAEFVDPII